MSQEETLNDLISRMVYACAVRLARAGEYTEAERFLRLAPEPRSREHLLLLGRICGQQGRYDEAIAAWRSVEEISPGDSDASAAIARAVKLAQHPELHPARRLERWVRTAGAVAVAVALVVSLAANHRLKSSIRDADVRHSAEIAQLEDELAALRDDRDLSGVVEERLRSEPRLTGFPIQVDGGGGRIRCFGDVSSLELKDLISRLALSVNGVESADVTGVGVTHTYVTMRGDALSAIAYIVYGDAIRWREIHAANDAKLPDPDAISPRQVLRIP